MYYQRRGVLLLAGSLALLMVSGCGKSDPIETEPAGAESERQKFQGNWSCVSVNIDGESLPAFVARDSAFRFAGNSFTQKIGARDNTGTIVLDPSRSPPAIDLVESTGTKIFGIYRLEGDSLTLCFSERVRPEEFEPKKGQRRLLIVLKRAS